MDAKFLRMLAANLSVCADEATTEAEKASKRGEKGYSMISASAGLTIDLIATSIVAALDELAKEPK